MRSRILMVLLAVGFLTPTLQAKAALVTLDFDVGSGGLFTSPYFEDGFQLTPSCHYDIPEGPVAGDNWFGWDISGCIGGPPASVLLERRDGGLFHPLSLDMASVDFGNAEYDAEASSGASMLLTHDCAPTEFYCHKMFVGSGWRNLSNVEFTIPSDFGAPQGFDNLVLVTVPEPSVVALLLLGLMTITVVTRRRSLSLWSATSTRRRPSSRERLCAHASISPPRGRAP